MWLNEYEELNFKPFNEFIDSNEGKLYKFELAGGAVLIVSDYSGAFESDNGLDVGQSGYEEFWERAFEIKEIIKDDSNEYAIGQKICINYHCVPVRYDVFNG